MFPLSMFQWVLHKLHGSNLQTTTSKWIHQPDSRYRVLLLEVAPPLIQNRTWS